MKKYIAFCLAMIMVFALVACGTTQTTSKDNNDNVQNSAEPANTDNNEKDNKEDSSSNTSSEPAVISIDETDAENISNDKYCTYSDYSGEFAATIKISTNSNVKNFKFVEVECTDVSESGEAIYKVGNTLYSLDTFSSDKPVVISFSAPEIFATRAISYTDVNGDNVLLTILMSGEDGHFYFEEILN